MFHSPVRFILALMLLLLSVGLLLWSLLPTQRVVQRQFLRPTQMQMPAPSGFLPSQVYLPLSFSGVRADAWF